MSSLLFTPPYCTNISPSWTEPSCIGLGIRFHFHCVLFLLTQGPRLGCHLPWAQYLDVSHYSSMFYYPMISSVYASGFDVFVHSSVDTQLGCLTQPSMCSLLLCTCLLVGLHAVSALSWFLSLLALVAYTNFCQLAGVVCDLALCLSLLPCACLCLTATCSSTLGPVSMGLLPIFVIPWPLLAYPPLFSAWLYLLTLSAHFPGFFIWPLSQVL